MASVCTSARTLRTTKPTLTSNLVLAWTPALARKYRKWIASQAPKPPTMRQRKIPYLIYAVVSPRCAAYCFSQPSSICTDSRLVHTLTHTMSRTMR